MLARTGYLVSRQVFYLKHFWIPIKIVNSSQLELQTTLQSFWVFQMVFTVLINGYSTWYRCCLEAPQVIHSPCQASKPIVFLTISPSSAVVSSGHHWYARSWSFPLSLWRHGNPSYPFFSRRSMLKMPLFKQSQDSVGFLSCFHLPTH